MNVVGICGSLSQKSYNLSLLQACKSLAPKIVSFEMVTLEKIPIFFPDQDIPEVVEELCHQVLMADRIIFATPEYNYSISGALKNTLDWLSKHKGKPLAKKKAAIVGASGGMLGTCRAQYHLRQIGVYLDIHFINKPEIMVGVCHKKFDSDRELIDQDTKRFLEEMWQELI